MPRVLNTHFILLVLDGALQQLVVYKSQIFLFCCILLLFLVYILDISKIEADKIEVEMLDVNLPQLIKEIDANIRLKAEEKGLEYKLNIQYSIPFYIRIDPTRLKQVLFNLSSNAIKFTEEGHIYINVYCLNNFKKYQAIFNSLS